MTFRSIWTRRIDLIWAERAVMIKTERAQRVQNEQIILNERIELIWAYRIDLNSTIHQIQTASSIRYDQIDSAAASSIG